mgnify:CR=1 FL=1
MKKGFTLVELLVVVAILGVLAAVGIVSFGGYLGSAKEKSLQTNHNNILKFMESSILKCMLMSSTGEEARLPLKKNNGTDYTYNCSNIVAQNAQSASGAFVDHFDGEGLKNPYNSSQPLTYHDNCVHQCSNCELGRIHISGEDDTGSNKTNIIWVMTRYKNDPAQCYENTITME